jgi:CRP-like cAMP-binding protein
LRREDLEQLIMKKPEVGLRLVRELAERLRESERRYADIVGKEVPARLATQRVNRTRRRPGRYTPPPANLVRNPSGCDP